MSNITLIDACSGEILMETEDTGWNSMIATHKYINENGGRLEKVEIWKESKEEDWTARFLNTSIDDLPRHYIDASQNEQVNGIGLFIDRQAGE